MIHTRCLGGVFLVCSAVNGGAFLLNPAARHDVITSVQQQRDARTTTAALVERTGRCRSRVPSRVLATDGDSNEAALASENVRYSTGKAVVGAAATAAAAAAVAIVSHPAAAGAATDVLAAGAEVGAGAGLQISATISQVLADPASALAANPEWTRYAFMFPVGILVATCAQTAGIGGAALTAPVFLLGFPLLGPDYPLHSVAASVATAILCEAFGFSSGLLGYFRRGLIDPGSALPFILASIPSCLLGALIVPYADERVLKAIYAVFMLGLSAYLLLDEQGSESLVPEECSVEELESGDMKAICTSEGTEYIYRKPDFGTGSGLSTAFGGLMTGMLGVGIGEVVIPQLVKKNGVPLPVAAGTSILVVFLNAVVAAGTQIGGIVSRGGEDVPWNLIAFIVPGVVIGGQLAPKMQGRLSQRTMEKVLAGVFGGVGVTFAAISVKTLLSLTSVST
ncbi:conserved unknown protein [Ectocarpus siliculosus]|uniref:Membrane transporter protein n=1 Tax=Ectocarpus siliculosus TaxID=2880 RepID=D7FW33_ECTSI|nr:conserved unknown protein [Ectocarpus siliculosus]|eukprot:CBJ25553.1 conserved unknown protein [Ectocarpus siliculosus]